MKPIPIAAAAVMAVLMSAPLARAERVMIPDCLVLLLDEARVPAQEQGVLKEVLVREGQQVRAGDVLARIDDHLANLQLNVARAELAAAEKKAADVASIEFAQAGAEVKAAQYHRLRKANERKAGAVADTDIDLARLEWVQFDKQTIKSQFELAIAALEADVSKANLAAAEEHARRCEIKAPWAGAVAELALHTGDWVKPGDPILQLVRMDKLAVKCLLRTDQYAPHRVAGAPVVIVVKLADRESPQFTGKVSGISPLVMGTGEFDVWVEVENRQRNDFWLLRPGMRAEMTLELK